MIRPHVRQELLPFLARSEALERRFKVIIATVTALLLTAMVAGTPTGRYYAQWLATRGRWSVMKAIGLRPSRAEIDADWNRRRMYDIASARRKLATNYASYTPPMRRLLDYAGLDPDHALLRWGNFDRALLLPATVFEPDDTGRSYRLRPNLRSVWVRNLQTKEGVLSYFPVPDTPALTAAVAGSSAIVVATSVQTTNSWGLRGPEPDLDAPLRGVVLGDSYMQGLFVGDDDTPTECLKRCLRNAFHTPVEVLNTGHLGYSPEQEFYTLQTYCDRIRPAFVVLSIFANDFGDLFEVLEGKGDWEEGRYWLGRIIAFCRSRSVPCLAVPAPWVNQIVGPRDAGHYPGQVSNILDLTSLEYLDPIDDFADEQLRLQLEDLRAGRSTTASRLFNGHLADNHFSALGCRVWARAVARRLVLLLEEHDLKARQQH